MMFCKWKYIVESKGKISTLFLQGSKQKHSFSFCAYLLKRDKYSLKNIGSSKPQSTGNRKAPNYKRFGGSKEFPVSVFQLPKLSRHELELNNNSSHKSMIENALHSAIEALLFSGEFSEVLATCPIEITKVEVATNFSSAAVYWKIDKIPDGPTEEQIEQELNQNLEFIRNMLPAYHSMTHTPLVTLIKDRKNDKEKEIDDVLSLIKDQNNC